MISYKKMTKSDFPEWFRLYEEYLNSGDYIEDTLRRSMESPHFVGIKAEDEGKMIGFLSGTDEMEFTYPHEAKYRRIMNVIDDEKYFSPDSLLVLPEYRGNGIADTMMDQMKDILHKKRYKYFAVEIWVYADGRSPARIPYERMGEVLYKERAPLFYRKSKKYGIKCPICGENCKCGALLEVMKL